MTSLDTDRRAWMHGRAFSALTLAARSCQDLERCYVGKSIDSIVRYRLSLHVTKGQIIQVNRLPFLNINNGGEIAT